MRKAIGYLRRDHPKVRKNMGDRRVARERERAAAAPASKPPGKGA